MTWMQLTQLNGVASLVDISKVTQINAHSSGSQLLFEMTIDNNEKKTVARTLVVLEPIEKLARTLKARVPK